MSITVFSINLIESSIYIPHPLIKLQSASVRHSPMSLARPNIIMIEQQTSIFKGPTIFYNIYFVNINKFELRLNSFPYLASA